MVPESRLIGVAQMVFLPVGGTISVTFFRLNTLKGTAIILTVVILDFRTLSGTNLRLLAVPFQSLGRSPIA